MGGGRRPPLIRIIFAVALGMDFILGFEIYLTPHLQLINTARYQSTAPNFPAEPADNTTINYH